MLYNSICKTVNTYFILFWRYYFPAPTGRWGQRSKQVRSRGCRSALGTLRVWPQGAGKCWTNEALNGISDFLDSSFWKSYYILLYIWFYKYTCLLVCIYVCINICKPKPSFHFLARKFQKKKLEPFWPMLQTWQFSYAECVQLWECHLSSWDLPFRSPSSIIFNLPLEDLFKHPWAHGVSHHHLPVASTPPGAKESFTSGNCSFTCHWGPGALATTAKRWYLYIYICILYIYI